MNTNPDPKQTVYKLEDLSIEELEVEQNSILDTVVEQTQQIAPLIAKLKALRHEQFMRSIKGIKTAGGKYEPGRTICCCGDSVCRIGPFVEMK